MTDEDAFLEAIRAAPDEDAPRLIYADWLDENGDSDRAEFIRVQIALARPKVPGRAALRERERSLLKANRERWLGPINPRGFPWQLARGFIEQFDGGGNEFLQESANLGRLAALRRVCLWQSGWTAAELAACAALEGVTTLELTYCGLRAAGARALTLSPYLGRLAHLDMAGNGIRLEGASALLTSKRLPRITSLGLHSTGLGVRGVRGVVGLPEIARLTALTLGDDATGAEGAHAVAASRHLKGLRWLAMWGAGIGRAGAEPLAASPNLTALSTLLLHDNNVGAAGALAIAASPSLANLTVLDLSRNNIRDRGARALVESPYLRHITHLDLRGGNHLSRRWQDALRKRFGKAVTL
jgi:uncharacterized protein (TIGR02996 family)